MLKCLDWSKICWKVMLKALGRFWDFLKKMFYQFILSFKKSIFEFFWNFEIFLKILKIRSIFLEFFIVFTFFSLKNSRKFKNLKKRTQEKKINLWFSKMDVLNGLQPPKGECAKRMNQTSCPEEDRRVLPGLPSEGKNQLLKLDDCSKNCAKFGHL